MSARLPFSPAKGAAKPFTFFLRLFPLSNGLHRRLPGTKARSYSARIEKAPQVRLGLRGKNYSHSANSSIWECIWGDFIGKTFANMLMFCPLI